MEDRSEWHVGAKILGERRRVSCGRAAFAVDVCLKRGCVDPLPVPGGGWIDSSRSSVVRPSAVMAPLSSFLSLPLLASGVAAVSLSVASSGGNSTSGYQYGLMFEDINHGGDGGM